MQLQLGLLAVELRLRLRLCAMKLCLRLHTVQPCHTRRNMSYRLFALPSVGFHHSLLSRNAERTPAAVRRIRIERALGPTKARRRRLRFATRGCTERCDGECMVERVP